jgi:tetratricopeptide (TPR) repeat protein
MSVECQRHVGMAVAAARPARKAGLFAAAALAAATLVIVAYSDSLSNAFHFDDSHVIVNNIYIRSLANVPRFFADASTFSSLPPNASYRPLVSATLALDYAIGRGLAPRQFHRTQIALLLLLGLLLTLFYDAVLSNAVQSRAVRSNAVPSNAVLSKAVLSNAVRREARGGGIRLTALFTAALFCVHTANTETLNFISARSELLSVAGVIGSFLLYLNVPRARTTGLHLAPMVAGALAKVHAVMYAPLLLVYVWLFPVEEASPRVRLREAVRATWPSFVVAAVSYLLVSHMDGPRWTPGGGSRLAYAWTQPFVWLHYARLFVLPLGLTADTDWQPFAGWYDTRAIAGDLFIVLLIAIFVRAARARETRPIAFGVAWFAVALAPTSSLVPFSEIANEHRLFFPFVGLALAAVWSLVLAGRAQFAGVAPRGLQRATAAAAIVVLVAHGIGTWDRNRVWRSEASLWLDVTRKSPQNGRGLMNYGLTRMQEGDLQGARDAFERAVLLTPNYSTLQVNLGIAYGALGQRPAAEAHFRRALEIGADADGHYYYGRWLAGSGRGPEAVAHLLQAVSISPARLDARDLLMQLDAAAGEDGSLVTLARDTLTLDPSHLDAAAYARGESPAARRAATTEAAMAAGLSALAGGRFDEAAECFRQMVRLNPRSADGWNNRGWAQLQLGFAPAAVTSFERALAIDPGFERARNNLALARKAL